MHATRHNMESAKRSSITFGKRTRGLATIAIVVATSAFPTRTAAQMTPTDEVATEWTELAPTTAPELATKASRSMFAIKVETDCSPSDCGTWAALADGTVVWTHGFRSAEATSMSLEIESRDGLPEGGELSVRGEGESHEVRISSGLTPIVSGEEIILQYTGPQNAEVDFRVTGAYCGFKHIEGIDGDEQGSRNKALSYGDSQSCEVSAACDERTDDIRRSVCRLILNNNMVGTGTLINTTAGDRAPLVLTSAHVVNADTIKTCTALFGFEEPFCEVEGYYNYGTETIQDAELVAFDAPTDMAIIRLSRTPSMASNPYWAGWSLTADTTGHAFCIHHPYGDVKKISTTDSATPIKTYTTTDKNATGGSFKKNVFWEVGQWTVGATEGGSSGSALIDSTGSVIGALSGGYASCKSPKRDYFWMLSKAWDASSDGYATLGQTLDPQGTGATAINGIEGLEVNDIGTQTMRTYDPRSEEIAAAEVAVGNEATAIRQPITPTNAQHATTIYGIRLYADVAVGGSKTDYAMITVGVCTSDGAEAQGTAVQSVYTFRTERIVDFILDEPITATAGQTFYIKIGTQNCTKGENVTLKTAPATSEAPEAQYLSGSTWMPLTGCAIAMDIIYSTTAADTSIQTPVETGDLKLRANDGIITLTGEPMSSVAIYDRRGQLTDYVAAHGHTEISITLCSRATGIYILKVMCESGNRRTFKVVNI